MLHFLFKNPSLFPTHQLIHTLYLGYSSNLQQKSVCMPFIGLIPLMSTSLFILFYNTLVWTPGQQRNKNIEMFCSLAPRLVARRQLEASDIRPHFYPPPLPHPPLQRATIFSMIFQTGNIAKKDCPEQTDLSGTGTVMQFFGTTFFLFRLTPCHKKREKKFVFSQK